VRIGIAAGEIGAPLFTPWSWKLGNLAPRMTVEILSPENIRRAVLNSDADIGLGFGEVAEDVSLTSVVARRLDWAVFAPPGHPFAANRHKKSWSSAKHIAVVGQGRRGPIEKAAQRLKANRQVTIFAPNFATAITMVGACNALFTTLKEPYETIGKQLGLEICELPFDVPAASAVLTMKSHFESPARKWLNSFVRTSFGLTNDSARSGAVIRSGAS